MPDMARVKVSQGSLPQWRRIAAQRAYECARGPDGEVLYRVFQVMRCKLR